MFNRSRDDLVDTVQETLDEVAGALHQARKRIRAAGSETADGFRRSTRSTIRASEDATDTANDYVREHPGLTVGIATAIAALLAWLVFSRR